MNIQNLLNVSFSGKVEDKKGTEKRPYLLPQKPDTFERTTTESKNVAKKDTILDNIVKMYNKKVPIKLDTQSTELMVEDNLDANKVLNLAKDMTNSKTKKVTLRRCDYDKDNNYVMKSLSNEGSNLRLLDKDLNVLEQENIQLKFNAKGKAISKKVMTQDFRTNTFNETKFEFSKEGYPMMTEAVKIRRDKNGKLIRKETYEKSDVDGMFNVKYEFPNGKTRQVSKATVDKKTGHTLIEKDMRSTDMTRTQFRYEDDPQGNRIIDYKITDKDGKVLMNQSQSFEVLGENKFRSSRNDKSYLIEYDKKANTLNVVDEQKNDGFNIPIKNFILPKEDGHRTNQEKVNASEQKIVNMLKKIPGDELLNLANTTVQIEDIDNKLGSYCMPNIYQVGEDVMAYGTLNVSDDPFVFLHELGHATDMCGKPVDLIKNGEGQVVEAKLLDTLHEDETFKKTYEEERQNFLKEFPTNERNHIDYFIEQEAVAGQPERGREETIAETNALMNTYQTVDILGIRTQYLQQHFPKTIAYLSEKLTPTK